MRPRAVPRRGRLGDVGMARATGALRTGKRRAGSCSPRRAAAHNPTLLGLPGRVSRSTTPSERLGRTRGRVPSIWLYPSSIHQRRAGSTCRARTVRDGAVFRCLAALAVAETRFKIASRVMF